MPTDSGIYIEHQQAGIGTFLRRLIGEFGDGVIEIGQHSTGIIKEIRATAGSSGVFSVYSGTNQRLGVTTNGSVNIGGDYTQATNKLQVTGDAKIIDGDLTISKSGVDPTFTVQTTEEFSRDALIRIRGARTTAPDSNIAMLQFDNKTNNPYTMAQISAMDAVGNHDEGKGKLVFRTASGGTLSDQMVIKEDGNVGIGTNNPSAKLHIGPVDGDSTPHLYLASQNNDYGFRIDTDDFLGGNVPLRIFARSNGTDTERIRVTQDGDVGINSTAPAAKLDVKGDSLFENVRIGAGSSITIPEHNDNTALYLGDSFTAPSYPSGSVGARLRQNTPGNTTFEFNNLFNTGRNFYFSAPSNAGNLFYVSDNPSVGVRLFCGGNNLKLQTVGTGITVYGTTQTQQLNVSGISTFAGKVSAGGTTGTDGYYLKSTGIGVTWAVFPSSRTTSTQTATAGQTSFNFNYNVGFVDVFLNGVKLPSSEFTASNGSTIVLDDAAFANDTLEFISLNTVPVTSGGGSSNLDGLADVSISGTPVIGETLQHNGSEFVNDYTVSATTTSTSQTAILSLPIATYRSAEYTIQVTEGTKYHVTKVLAIHDGTNVTFNEYGTLTTSTSLSTFGLDVNSGNMRLLATPASTNSTVFKVKFTGIKV
jgi:hypothetical protein